MNDILGLVGGIFIVGASYLFANKKKRENERLQKRVNKLENENHDFWTANLKKNKTIKHCKSMEAKQVKEFIEIQKEIDELKGDKNELHKTILFDNDLLIQKTEMNEFMEDKIVKLDSESEAKASEILYLRRKLKRVRANRLKRVIKAEKLGVVKNVLCER